MTGAQPPMQQDQVVRRRLRAQLLRAPGVQSPDDVVRHFLAVQAQEFPYARWSLAQRTRGDEASGDDASGGATAAGATAADVEQAVSDGRILRTHILRPTWHFVHRDDLRWLTALSAPRLRQANAATYRRSGIDPAAADRSGRVLAEAVQGGRHRTREQLAEHLQRAGFPATGLGLAYLIMHAEISGVLTSGVPVRSPGGALKQTYALFDERVPAGPGELMAPRRSPRRTCPALLHEPRSRHGQGLRRLIRPHHDGCPPGPHAGHRLRTGGAGYNGD